MQKRVVRQIEPADDDELEVDLRFLYYNRSDTVDLFVDEAMPIVKTHINQAMERYQERLLDDLTDYMRGEIAGIITRVRRETTYITKDDVSDW